MNIFRLSSVSILCCVQTVFGMTANEQLQFWRLTFQSKDLGAINTRVAEAAAEWPKIYSSARTVYANDGERQKNADYSQLGITLFEIIESYANDLDRGGAKAIIGVEELLKARKWILNSPSYLNYALIDTINRQVLVRQMELLSQPDADSSRIIRGLGVLTEFRFDPAAWRTMLGEEQGALIDEDANDFGAFQKNNQQRVLERSGLRNLNEYRTRELLRGQHYAALGWRMVVTDYYLCSVLPALLEYWRKAKSPAISDEYPKIRDVLGKDTLVSESIGAEFLERQRACAAVDDIFRETRTREIRRHLKLIQDSDIR